MSVATENSAPSPRWAPQPGPQTEAITADWCPELLYGGAVGGGKSDFLLGDFLQGVPTYENAWRGILMRRTYPELEELVSRSLELYPGTDAKWNDQKKTWTWPNGAQLKMRYCESDKDVLRYHGHQYTWIGWDELTQWATLYPYRYLRSRLRSAHDVPKKRIRASTNPGGAGHAAVRAYFIDPAPQGYVPICDEETKLERMFIPSLLQNNRILMMRDPDYINRVRGLGSENLVRALLEGDWGVIEGAFFTEWSEARHVLRPVDLPQWWNRFRAADWGSAKPYSVHWFAVASDDWQHPDGMVIPRGALVVYRELYGVKTRPGGGFDPNTGVKEPSDVVARRILALEGAQFDAKGKKISDPTENIAYGVLDPAAFATVSGPSIAETMAREGCLFRPADNKRVASVGAVGGHDQFRKRLTGDGEGRPMLFFFSNCIHAIRTIPMLQHDKAHPEDLDSELEDHAYDSARYGCMSRPYLNTKAPSTPEEAERQAIVAAQQARLKERQKHNKDRRRA